MNPLEVAAPVQTPDRVIVNVGPSHPATHGTFRVTCVLEGERIVDSYTQIGYLHRCFEKMAETHTYTQVIPFTDRLNYCSAFMNNVGYCMAVEKLLGIEIPRRAMYVRVILSEFSRIIDHLVCVTTNLVDLGAITNFWYGFTVREMIYTLLEKCCGARLTVNYARIGGLQDDVPKDFLAECKTLLAALPRFYDDIAALNTRNRIFHERTRGVGPMSPESAKAWGWTGPCLRASGVAYDIRKAEPYYEYDTFDFDIPVGTAGDTYDRYLVRMEEIRQSARIIEQAIEGLPEGDFIVRDRRIALPPKDDVYTNIEALMDHFKLIMHGILPPPGQLYLATEAANGELGFYVISDGGKKPYRLGCRAPCFAIFQAFDEMLKGCYVADLVAILGSLNIVAGELER
jgi:NADH dehydrogenase I D subunit